MAAKHLGAELVVIPLRYKNPTARGEGDSEEWWAPEVTPYLFDGRKKLNPNLVLVGDVKIQATASEPLTGFESLTGAESCILAHTKLAFKSVAVPTGRFPKILTTTGACTAKNYSDTKAGKIGAFHHCIGAVLVEIEGKAFHLRQVNADRGDGSFTDLDQHYSPKGVTKAPPALALVMGDMHARFTDPAVDRATFGAGGIVETLNPETLVFHDVIDGYAVNPHHKGDPFVSMAKAAGNAGNVEEEIDHCAKFLSTRTKGRKAVLVSSNHDDFLGRWVRAADWKSEGQNKIFYLKTALAMAESVRFGAGGSETIDAFKYWMDIKGPKNVRTLDLDESLQIAGIECGMHGHQGPNGSKGSLKNLSRLGAKTITGHSHTPGIVEGAYSVGTSTPLRLEYTHGPSSWLNSHVVIYASGKRSIITIIDGKWRTK